MKTPHIPDFTLPGPLTRLGGRLPQLPATVALVTCLNLALDRLIPREPLDMLIGKRFVIRVKDAGLGLRFTYGRYGFRPAFDSAPPDLAITARLRDFLALLLREEDPDTLFFNRRLLMEGDTDLGLLVKNTLDGVELPRFDPLRFSLAHLLASRLPGGLPLPLITGLRQRFSPPHGI